MTKNFEKQKFCCHSDCLVPCNNSLNKINLSFKLSNIFGFNTYGDHCILILPLLKNAFERNCFRLPDIKNIKN